MQFSLLPVVYELHFDTTTEQMTTCCHHAHINRLIVQLHIREKI
jgi:hypothetical protein